MSDRRGAEGVRENNCRGTEAQRGGPGQGATTTATPGEAPDGSTARSRRNAALGRSSRPNPGSCSCAGPNYGLPALGVGVGLRRPHIERVIAEHPAVPFFEFCPENVMDRGGRARRDLLAVSERYPVVSHGVGLGIGSVDPLDHEYLRRLRRLIDETGALWASDHLCWNRADGRSSNDLLPLPFTAEAVHHTAARIREVQEFLGVPFLVENISTYTILPGAEMSEGEFTRAVLEEADCGMLLDVNNVYVNWRNNGTDPHAFLHEIPAERVGQMHMAGHDDRGHVCVDTHGAPVRDEVWELFRDALALTGPTSVLLEWDSNIPDLGRLLAEAATCRAIYDDVVGAVAAPAHACEVAR